MRVRLSSLVDQCARAFVGEYLGKQAVRRLVADHVYPPHAAFGGYKQSGFGRETHKMALDHYQQTKNLMVSYADEAQGFF